MYGNNAKCILIYAIGNLIFNDQKSSKIKYETTLYFICHTFVVNEKCACNFQICC